MIGMVKETSLVLAGRGAEGLKSPTSSVKTTGKLLLQPIHPDLERVHCRPSPECTSVHLACLQHLNERNSGVPITYKRVEFSIRRGVD